MAAAVWGTDDGAFSLMDLDGVLRRMESEDGISELIDPELVGEEAVSSSSAQDPTTAFPCGAAASSVLR